MSRRGPNKSRNRDSPSAKCVWPSRRANQRVEVRAVLVLRMRNCPFRWMDHKFSNGTKMSKGNGNNTITIFP